MPNTYNTLPDLFGAIADSIRSKTGGSAEIVADDFPSAIDDIIVLPPVAVVTDVAVKSSYIIVADAGEGQDFSGYNNAAVICKDTVDISALPLNGDVLIDATFSKRSAPVQGFGYDASITSVHNRESIRLSNTLANIETGVTRVTITLGAGVFRASGAYCVILWRE